MTHLSEFICGMTPPFARVFQKHAVKHSERGSCETPSNLPQVLHCKEEAWDSHSRNDSSVSDRSQVAGAETGFSAILRVLELRQE